MPPGRVAVVAQRDRGGPVRVGLVSEAQARQIAAAQQHQIAMAQHARFRNYSATRAAIAHAIGLVGGMLGVTPPGTAAFLNDMLGRRVDLTLNKPRGKARGKPGLPFRPYAAGRPGNGGNGVGAGSDSTANQGAGRRNNQGGRYK